MKQEIDIDQLMAETWLTVSMLKKGATTLDGAAFYQKCCRQVEAVRDALKCAGFDEASIGHISYAQCALLDEAVMSRRGENAKQADQGDKGQVAWRKAPLQARYFGSLYAGEALWDRLAEVLRQPAPVNAVLTCYHRVISLGFLGLYSIKTFSQSQRDEVIKALAARVTPPDMGLSLVIHRSPKRRYRLLRSIWLWIVVALILTGTVWWCGHLWLQDLLSAQISERPH